MLPVCGLAFSLSFAFGCGDGDGDPSGDLPPIDAGGSDAPTWGAAVLSAIEDLATNVCGCEDDPDQCAENLDDELPILLDAAQRECFAAAVEEAYPAATVECWVQAFQAAAECAERRSCEAGLDESLRACLSREVTVAACDEASWQDPPIGSDAFADPAFEMAYCSRCPCGDGE